jgi:hypothetical protein
LRDALVKIVIETETPDDRAMFRVLLGDRLVGEGLTAVQAQLVVAEVIERLVLPRIKPKQANLRLVAG